MQKLTEEQIQHELKSLHDWKYEDGEIKKKFKFENFDVAMGFVNRVATIAEEHKHHPKIEIDYNKVEIELTTHDVDGLTELDFVLARTLDAIATTQEV